MYLCAGRRRSRSPRKPRANWLSRGDAVVYTLTLRNTDPSRPTTALTLLDSASAASAHTDTLRVNGAAVENGLTPDAAGHGFALALNPLAPGAALRITYAMTVREDAPLAMRNEASLTDADGNVAQTQASVRVLRAWVDRAHDDIGQVLAQPADGICTPQDPLIGIPGVRVTMEDGSFAITDIEGRYHFEGVVPGNHVVQVARATLPEGGEFLDLCGFHAQCGQRHFALCEWAGRQPGPRRFPRQCPKARCFARLPRQRARCSTTSSSGASVDFFADGDGRIPRCEPQPAARPLCAWPSATARG